MPTNNPRYNVTFSKNGDEIIKLICKKNNTNPSAFIRKIVYDWIEEYEDYLWALKAEEAEKRWITSGKKTIGHEEMCKKLNIK